MKFTRSIDSLIPQRPCQTRLQQRSSANVMLAGALLLIVTFAMGCNQQRYTPAKWRSLPRGENAGMNTLPEMGTLPGGMGTLPGRMGTLPGRMGTLPGRMGTLPGRMGTLPGRMGTLPGRMGTLPGKMGTLPGRGGNDFKRFGEITDWFDANSPSRPRDENENGNSGTTLP